MKPKSKVFQHFSSKTDNSKVTYCCNYCNVVYTFKNATRFAYHLNKCQKTPSDVQNCFKQYGKNKSSSSSSQSHAESNSPSLQDHRREQSQDLAQADTSRATMSNEEKRNGSIEYDGSFLMNTGASDFSQLGNVEKWRHYNRTMYRDECGEVRGSTGELWAPELGQPEVEVFASDICTYLTLSKNKDVYVDGIDGVEYAANLSVFDNGYNYPRMACYCDEVRDRDCLPPGALNVSACRYGAPAFVSLPHFLHSDPYYPNKIEGLAPTEEHNFRLALEMYTGMPLQVAAQLQISLLVRHVPGMHINNQLPDSDVLVPMFWFRQEVQITPEYARMARMALNLRNGLPYALYALTGIGLLLIVIGIVILIKTLLKSPDTTPIMSESSNSEEQ